MTVVEINLLGRFARPCLTVCRVMRVERRDGQVFGFSEHDEPIERDGVTYLPGTIRVDATHHSVGFSADPVVFAGKIDSVAITEDDIYAGVWDAAKVTIMRLDWMQQVWPWAIEKTGTLGEAQSEGAQFSSECRGETDRFNRRIGEVTSPTCRYRFGDSRCRVSLSFYTSERELRELDPVEPRRKLLFTQSFVAGILTGGRLKFLAGKNAGQWFDIKASGNSGVELEQDLPFMPADGDRVEVVAGCAKTVEACKSFDNLINFGGEPHMPGQRRLTEVAG